MDDKNKKPAEAPAETPVQPPPPETAADTSAGPPLAEAPQPAPAPLEPTPANTDEPVEAESLESPDPPASVEADASPETPVSDSQTNQATAYGFPQQPADTSPPLKRRRLRVMPGRTLITAGIFLLAVVLLVGGAFFLRPKPKPDQTVIINTQNLDSGTLSKLTPQGSTSTQLTITADVLTVNDLKVQGTAEVQRDLNVRGNLAVNGTTSLQATNISGTLTLNGGLTVSGNSSLSGNLSVTGLLTTGGLSVGSITTSNLTVNNNLTLGGHLIPTGSTPSVSAGPAARGGSVSVSGNDTAGTITINTGNQGLGGAHTGEMAVITFRTPFATTPKVQLTPINIDAAGLDYYAARGPRFFNVNSTSTVADGTTYVFDYLVTQ